MLTQNRKSIKFSSTLVRMALIILIPLTVILVAVVVVSQSLHHTAMQKLVGDRNLRAVQAASAAIESELSLAAGQLSQDTADNIPLVGEASSKYPLGLYSVTCPTAEVDTTIPPTVNLGITAADVPASEVCQQGSMISDGSIQHYFTEYKSKQIVWVAASTKPDTVIVTGLEIKSLLDRLLEIPLGQDNLAILVYDANHILRYETGVRPAGEHDLYHASILNGLGGSSGVMLPSGGHGSHVVTYTPVAGVNWIIVMDEAWEDISNPSLDTTQWIPLILIPVIILFAAIMFLGYRQIIKPLNMLQQKTSQLNQGDEHALMNSVGGVEEIRLLQEILQKMSSDLIQSRENLAGYASDLTLAIEAEKKELARELHDDSLQDLIAIKQLVSAENSGESAAINEKIKAVIAKLRGVIRGLRPPYLDDLGLATALQVLAEERATPGMEISVNVDGEEIKFSPDVDLVLYRIGQEAMTNAIKHANPKRIRLELSYKPFTFELSIVDDGSGFSLPDRLDQLAAQHRYGLLGMHERAERAGCNLSISSHPGKGTRVQVRYSQKK